MKTREDTKVMGRAELAIIGASSQGYPDITCRRNYSPEVGRPSEGSVARVRPGYLARSVWKRTGAWLPCLGCPPRKARVVSRNTAAEWQPRR